ncbi:Vacuolar protease A [Entomortierella chlamydospora]|uniref:Vacuolar protease A n=1 Tax=Entomortierella chlamydospora TaxID=101097 RepID=A0A9P6SYZ3_9FUNG|nr:Vacuolar protease A [Entomortierella chlamydospora]KAG0012286.1 Vacuolar protease A [Entomortierella chlamydospora]
MALSQPWRVWETSRITHTTATATFYNFISFTFILNIFFVSPFFISPSHAATFKVSVTKTTTQTDAKSGSPLAIASNKLFASKYLGNSILSNNKYLAYTGVITLSSNPSQSFEVVFDTGSDFIVVTSDQCRDSQCNNITQYTCTSCKRTPHHYNITYGDGSWGYGPIVLDTVSIGGLVVHNQQILDATKSGLNLHQYGSRISGLIGLMPSTPVSGAVPPLLSIFKSNILDMNVFSVYLTDSLKKNEGGSILFGGIDSTKFVGTLNQLPISTAPGVREGMWYVDADNAFVGDTPIEGYTKSPWLFDTGTTFISVSSSFAKAFHEGVPGAVYSAADDIYTAPCMGNKTFGISFNGIKYEAPYHDYVVQIKPGSPICVSLVMPLPAKGMFVLGDPFLRQVYAVYDFTPSKARIGIAKVDTTNASLGVEGLSGNPPGGIGISLVRSSRSQSRFGTLISGVANAAISFGVIAAIMVMAA